MKVYKKINLDYFDQKKSEQLWDSIFVIPLTTRAECLLGSLRKDGNLYKILDCSTDLFADVLEMKVANDGKLLLSLRFTLGLQYAYAVINLLRFNLEVQFFDSI